MKKITFKIDETILLEVNTNVEKLGINREVYINQAIQHFNRLKMKKSIARKLQFESKLVAENSMNVLHEFEVTDDFKSL